MQKNEKKLKKNAKKFLYMKKKYYLCIVKLKHTLATHTAKLQQKTQTTKFLTKKIKEDNKMKTIKNGMAVKLKTWNGRSKFECAMICDMGVDERYKEYVTDENRVYASCRPLFLTKDKYMYEQENKRYENPIIVENGEIVTLEANGKQYKVHAMRKNFDFLEDILHFDLIK